MKVEIEGIELDVAEVTMKFRNRLQVEVMSAASSMRVLAASMHCRHKDHMTTYRESALLRMPDGTFESEVTLGRCE